MKTKGQLLITTSIILVVIFSGLIKLNKTLEIKSVIELKTIPNKGGALTSVDKKQILQKLKGKLTIDHIEISATEIAQNAFNDATDATQAQLVIDAAYKEVNNEFARELELKLHDHCAYPDFFTSMQNKNIEWLQHSISTFCSSYTATISHEEFIESSKLKSKKNIKKSSLYKKSIKNLDNNEKFGAIANLINHATSRTELANISLFWYKALQSNPSASLSQLQYPYVPSNDYFSDIYIASFDLYGCYKFGGCESNQWYILWICAISGQCQPGWSVYDFYENVLSLNELENVLIILQYLFDQQSNP